MKKVIWAIVVVAAAWALYSYVLFPDTGHVQVVLSEQGDSGVHGAAVLDEENGTLRVTLDLQGQPAGVPQPAHIHSGTCAALGGVLYPLTFPTDGGSETVLALSLAELREQGPVAINVHLSAEEPQTYVACGDIIL